MRFGMDDTKLNPMLPANGLLLPLSPFTSLTDI